MLPTRARRLLPWIPPLFLLAAMAAEATPPVPPPAASVPASSHPGAYHELEHVTLFLAQVATQRGELWVTDGTREGTLALDACGLACGSTGLAAGGSTRLAFFWISNSHGGYDLWRSDGTTAGTRRLTHFGASTLDPRPQFVWDPDLRRLLFWIHDDIRARVSLWSSDGTEDGTRPLMRLPAETSPAGLLTRAGDGLVFITSSETASGGLHLEVWSTDGTSQGTRRLTSLVANRFTDMVQTSRGALFTVIPTDISASFPCKLRLWSSHGTEATTRPMGDFEVPSYCPSASLNLQGDLGDFGYFTTRSTGGRIIWRTDGSPEGTVPAVDLTNRPEIVISDALGVWRGDVYFTAGDKQQGFELWRSDGTPGGTGQVADACPGDCSSNPNLLQPTEDLLFYYSGDFFDNRPWMTDGTATGTRPRPGFCTDCRSGWQSEVRAGSHRFLAASDPEHDTELWVSSMADGSMRRVSDFRPALPISLPTAFGRRGDRVVFAANDGIHGFEPWTSDGTAKGTFLLRDVASGAEPPVESPEEPPKRPPEPQLMSFPNGIRVFWTDVPGSTRYRIEVRKFDGSEESVVERISDNRFDVLDLQAGEPATVRMRAENAFGASKWSAEVSAAALLPGPEESCTPASDVSCLWGDRFRVDVAWRDQRSGDHGKGRTIPALDTDRTAHFWFFDSDNLELIVKLLDGSTLNGYWWTFYGALTDVEYWITVTDTSTGDRRTYHNPPGTVCGRGDTTSLYSLVDGAELSNQAAPRPPLAGAVSFTTTPAATTAGAHGGGPCVPDGETLCLLDSRFRVRVDWQNQHGGTAGRGNAVPFTDRTGLFTFFNPSNVELVVKALDGGPVNGRYWFFYGGLSDVGFTITVEDVVDGHAVRRYVNPPGEICGGADTAAF